jgi:ABC-type oligopeptide transport system substrate-binding subunit
MAKKRFSLMAVAAIALAAGALAVQACGSDDNPSPSNPVDKDSGADTATNDTATNDTATNDTATGDGADAGEAGDTAKPWDPDSGTCFPGTPTTYIELLNACTSADHLDWTTALPKKNADGTLPALP